MTTSHTINYKRIEEAIGYIRSAFKEQPALEDIARQVHMSPFHFQRMFREWAGISPKNFIRYLSVEYAKGILKKEQATLADASFEAGLSGTGRLHDLFIKIEGMTPGEYKNGGGNLSINYSFAETPFGDIIVASTQKGICHLAFTTDKEQAFRELVSLFPQAQYTQKVDRVQQNALYFFTQDWTKLSQVKLHLKGTPFQIKVWEALLKIPPGDLSTYSRISEAVASQKASRAVGSAIGSNPVAFLIPCHRVIRASGEFGQYHWGSNRKIAMIGWEAAHAHGSS